MATDTAPRVKGRARRANQPPGAAPSGDGASIVSPVRTKRSWGVGFAMIALVIVGGLGSLFLINSFQHTEKVFVVNTTIQRGQAVTAGELAAIDVAPGQRLSAFTDPAGIVGKVATVTLPAGSLVTPSSVASKLPIPQGESLVGIALKPSQMPSVPLNPGDRVVIVPIAAQQGTAQAGQPAAGPVNATVATTGALNQTTGLIVVNVYVSQSSASDVAGRAAAGMVTLYVNSAGQ